MVLDALTSAESYGLRNAVTNPNPTMSPAYALVDDPHRYWEFVLGGGEIATMCTQWPGAFVTPPDLPYLVERAWSNHAPAVGHDPCAPAPTGSPYFNAAPVLNDVVGSLFNGQQVDMNGVTIPVGTTKTIEIDLFSDRDTGGPWIVDAVDAAQYFGSAPHLSFAFDRTTDQNGEKPHLAITVMTAGKGKLEPFLLKSTLGTNTNYWIGLVGS